MYKDRCPWHRLWISPRTYCNTKVIIASEEAKEQDTLQQNLNGLCSQWERNCMLQASMASGNLGLQPHWERMDLCLHSALYFAAAASFPNCRGHNVADNTGECLALYFHWTFLSAQHPRCKGPTPIVSSDLLLRLRRQCQLHAWMQDSLHCSCK